MSQKAKTLKDNDWFKKTSLKNIIFSQQISSFQFYNNEKDYYLEVSIPKRAMVAETNGDASVFDVACTYSSCNKNVILNQMKAVLKERALSDIRCVNGLFAELKKDGILEEELKITDEDYAEILNTVCDTAIDMKKIF